ncbi:HypC/HybG/HupF family hydrogenase formation chaperone [Acidithiobacillus sp.]|jgi:hydrogenase expression/formation protein HypC|nr:HypC/HybG/HupF family hydrogenase formation chaperone [Acidithiobacillus sp.]
MCLGIPGQITKIISARERRAEVAINGVRREVNITCIADAEHPGVLCR